jgi:zinc transporter ZupT
MTRENMDKNEIIPAIAISALIPIIGLIIGIVLAARNHIGPALACWMASITAALIYLGS